VGGVNCRADVATHDVIKKRRRFVHGSAELGTVSRSVAKITSPTCQIKVK